MVDCLARVPWLVGATMIYQHRAREEAPVVGRPGDEMEPGGGAEPRRDREHVIEALKAAFTQGRPAGLCSLSLSR